ncbi:hypothetical protein [Chlamydiifrater volucris]|uniref:hypothetical protein n=1 Tax=Chlamydiifrater volucris TaxID=2681470 RepID=UPI001BCCDF54|nr:hypothetical protein [Chlamydiifrater volucris]
MSKIASPERPELYASVCNCAEQPLKALDTLQVAANHDTYTSVNHTRNPDRNRSENYPENTFLILED